MDMLVGIISVFVTILVLWFAWNSVVPDIFGLPKVSLSQAALLLAVANCLTAAGRSKSHD